ncbi:SCO family protein [Paenibacillus koleovorans]|uniref:SCO family protein n=1 Tax=Paenibacillus koleovorans TaxID=121608 RepID=UPI0013E2CA1D|nr:SCO family protein [Paenibacillus koleovorans]
MKEFVMKHWFKGVAAAAVIAIAAVLVLNTTVTSGGKLPVIKKAPDFKLESSDGTQAGLADSNGKIRLVYFFWSTCPDICQPTTYELSKVQEELQKEGMMGTDVAMYSISFDPDKDTAKQLASYSTRFQKDTTNWKFLRGEEKAMRDLANSYAVSVYKNPDGTFLHTNSIALVDRDGNIRKYITSDDNGSIVNYKDIVKYVKQLK